MFSLHSVQLIKAQEKLYSFILLILGFTALNSVLGLLHGVDVDDFSDASGANSTSIFRV
jgi:hypothetical protein